MDKKNKCDICGKAGRRLCPGINSVICSTCCGTKRNSEIACTSDCPHSPFSTTGYDLWLKINNVLPAKYMQYVISNYGKARFEKAIEDMSFGDPSSEHSFDLAAGSAAFYFLFIEQDKHKKTLADKWEAQGWEGLNNDEKVMMRYLKNSRATIIEIQKILDYQAMECVDIFEPKAKLFILFDRSTASRAVRFSRFFSWLCHFPNFSRIIHGGIEVMDFVFYEFVDIIKQDAKRISKRVLDFKLKDLLSTNFGEYCRLSADLAVDKRGTLLNNMDLHQCIATYDINGKATDIETVLAKYPEFRREDKEPKEADPPDTLYYSWLRRGQSKAIEEEMHPAFRHEDETMGVGTLANIRLYPDKFIVEVFSKQKYEFAKKMVARYFGSLLTLRQEGVVDIAKQMADRPIGEIPEIDEKGQVDISPEDKQKVTQLFYEHNYKKFMAENIPMIDNKTPRQAAKNPRLRPKLIELMKIHIKGIEQTNREKGTKINIDWVLDELGMPELK